MCLALPSQKPDCEDCSACLHINICLPTEATMKSTFIIAIVAMVGIAMTVTFGEQSSTVIHACSDSLGDTTIPCVQRYPETREVCEDQMVSGNITLYLPQVMQNNLMLSNVKVLIGDDEFSHGATLSGDFHNGDDGMDRWTSRILLEGNIMTYEIQNSKVQYRDEFECHMEIDIAGEKFESDPFQWFLVNNCAEDTTAASSITNKGESILSIREQLNQVNFSLNTLGSEVVELQKKENQTAQTNSKFMGIITEQLRAMHIRLENVSKQQDILSNKLDTQNNMLDTQTTGNKLDTQSIAVLVLLILLTAKCFTPKEIEKCLKSKLLGLLDCSRGSHPPSSSTSDDSSEDSQSSSSIGSKGQDMTCDTEAKQYLPEESTSLLTLNPSDEETKNQECVLPHQPPINHDAAGKQVCTNRSSSTNDKNHHSIEMSQIE